MPTLALPRVDALAQHPSAPLSPCLTRPSPSGAPRCSRTTPTSCCAAILLRPRLSPTTVHAARLVMRGDALHELLAAYFAALDDLDRETVDLPS
jgi:hypothetical protein